MKVMPIKWHQECYTDSLNYYLKERYLLDQKLKNIERAEKSLEFYRKQINTAIREKKEGFNRKSYLREKND